MTYEFGGHALPPEWRWAGHHRPERSPRGGCRQGVPGRSMRRGPRAAMAQILGHRQPGNPPSRTARPPPSDSSEARSTFIARACPMKPATKTLAGCGHRARWAARTCSSLPARITRHPLSPSVMASTWSWGDIEGGDAKPRLEGGDPGADVHPQPGVEVGKAAHPSGRHRHRAR